jgi:hypothetical protein
MGQQPTEPGNAKSAAPLATAREHITSVRLIISSEIQTANGAERHRYEAALRHLDLAIAEIDRKLAACNRGS